MSQLEDPARALLLTALEQVGIRHLSDPPDPNLFSQSYWDDNELGVISIHFSNWVFQAGKLNCTIELTDSAKSIRDFFPNEPEEQLQALVDLVEYYKVVLSTTLHIGHNSLIKRFRSIRTQQGAGHVSAYIALFEMMQAGFVDGRAALERRLAKETETIQEPSAKKLVKKPKGGSKARLEPGVRSALHERYDKVHGQTKQISGDYKKTFKKFVKERKSRGYNATQWKEHWEQHCAEKYEPEVRGLAVLFGDGNDPSASQVAYTYLAPSLGHSSSYLATLVTESRKQARSADSEKA